MSSRPPGRLPAIALLVVLAVLFAPNQEEQPASPVPLSPDSFEALILAPTVGDGIVAAGPKLWSPRLQPAEHSSLGTMLPSLPSALVLFLTSLTRLARREPRNAPRAVALRPSNPRGPPTLRAA